jgi:hypothetical protein
MNLRKGEEGIMKDTMDPLTMGGTGGADGKFPNERIKVRHVHKKS